MLTPAERFETGSLRINEERIFMKLLTFEKNGAEYWGFLIEKAIDGTDWVFNPAITEQAIRKYSSLPTSGYGRSINSFLEPIEWPGTLCEFLAMENRGMNALRRLVDMVRVFIRQSDTYLLAQAGWPLSDVALKAPIPRPRLLWGLVQNCPTFIRRDPSRIISNLFPQGHDRPQGSVVGAGETVVIPKETEGWGFNCELGVIIGRKGKEIPIDRAMDYVAGYTVITDIAHDCYYKMISDAGTRYTPKYLSDQVKDDWFTGAMTSWGGKKADTCCAMGPYMATKDEIGNPYDLLVYTRACGKLRDRSHTAGMLLGIERVLSWYSSFATLYPGDVIHYATMGVDGLPMEGIDMGPDDSIESEIEKIGVLRTPVVTLYGTDWRDESDGSRQYPSPAVRDEIRRNGGSVPAGEFDVAKARHFWTLFGNYRSVSEKESPMRPQNYPRFLNTPPSSLACNGAVLYPSARATNFTVGAELAFVVGKVASRISRDEADGYILGYLPIASFCDHSFREVIREPATKQERNLPFAYGRWGDGYNICGSLIENTTELQIGKRPMKIEIGGIGSVAGSTDEYTITPAEVLAFISQYITLFPNDVVTLGRIGNVLETPKDRLYGKKGFVSIESLGKADFSIAEKPEFPNDPFNP